MAEPVEEGRRTPPPQGGAHTLVLVVDYGRGAAPLAGALRHAGLRALEVADYEEALRDVDRWKPELVLVGRNPDTSSLFGFFGRARRAAPEARFLYLAECQDMSHIAEVIENGADDVVCPPHSVSAILVRQHVLRRFSDRRGERRVPRTASLGPLTVDLATRQVLDGGQLFSLSGREFELLVRLMEARGDVVSRTDLLDDIWGAEQGSEAVLDATVHRLRRKLSEHFHEPELVITVRGVGYRLDVEAIVRSEEAGRGP